MSIELRSGGDFSYSGLQLARASEKQFRSRLESEFYLTSSLLCLSIIVESTMICSQVIFFCGNCEYHEGNLASENSLIPRRKLEEDPADGIHYN